MLTYGSLSFKSYPRTDSLKVSIVQPNIPQYKKWDESYHQEITDTLLRLAGETEDAPLLVLPEASWPYQAQSSDLSALKGFVQEASRDMIIGAVEKDVDFHNSSFLFLKSGLLLDKYRKMNLVPFGEFVPFREFLDFIEEVSAFGDISPGSTYTLFPYKGSKIAVLICFEDVFPALVCRFVKKGATILVNMTNDAWFKGHPEARQHLQSAVFRAVEQRRFLVRAANTGISCIITPRGTVSRVLKSGKKDVFLEGILSGEVFSIEKRSVYNKTGDVLIYIGFIVCVLCLRKRRKSWK
jgi:apolipoprotein N-acyltransferase